MTPVVQSDRLWLRPLRLEDAEQVQEIFPKWEIVSRLASVVPWPYPPDGARQYFEQIALPAIERNEEWHWTLRLKTDPDRIIGAIGLILKGPSNRGFWIGLPWQGRGLMTEAASVITDYWFDAIKQPKLTVPKAANNAASRRISEKQGMRIVEIKESDYVSGRLPTEVWEITAAEWRSRRNMLS